jgi:hypothetical protein
MYSSNSMTREAVAELVLLVRSVIRGMLTGLSRWSEMGCICLTA